MSHHIDRRADKLAGEIALDGDPDELLSTSDVAEATGLSVQFYEIGRVNNYGPAYVRLSPRRIRYRRSDLVAWLRERTHRSTAEYDTGATRARPPGSRVVGGRVVPPDAA